MQTITLRDGEITLVDDEDFDELNQHEWYAVHHTKREHPTYYVNRYDERGKPPIIMHRWILKAPRGVLVDHRDYAGWNNQRDNIRLCTVAQNAANSRARREGEYRGVYRQKTRWIAKIGATTPTHNRYLGSFATPEEAARAWDAKALELWGEFARLNFPF